MSLPSLYEKFGNKCVKILKFWRTELSYAQNKNRGRKMHLLGMDTCPSFNDIIQSQEILNRQVFVLDILKSVWKFWKLLKILNRLWTDSEHYWKFWTNSINSEQILNITEKSEQILNITQNCEQILNITENSEQILNMDWSNKYQFYSLWFDLHRASNPRSYATDAIR